MRRYQLNGQTVLPLFKFWTTGNGYEYYDVLPGGEIVRLDQADFQPSGQWLLHSIKAHREPTILFAELTAQRVQTLDLLTKKGKPRWSVADIDHGTYREWGNRPIVGFYFYSDHDKGTSQ